MPLFAVTPVLRRGSKKEWWCASAPARPRWREPPRSGARREPGMEPATRLPTGYRPASRERDGRGWGAGRERMGILCRRRGRGGGAGRSVRVSPCWRRGRGGGGRQKSMGSLLAKARAGRGYRQKRMGILCRRRGRGGCRQKRMQKRMLNQQEARARDAGEK